MLLANATITVFSAAPVFSVFYKNLTIYLASSLVPSCSNFKNIASFYPAELLPDVEAILLNSWKTSLNFNHLGGPVFAFLKNPPIVD